MERALRRSIVSFMLAVLVVIASSPAQAVGGGDSLVVTEDPFDVYHRYQPLPGELDLETLDKTLVWKGVNRSVTTPILVEDLDRDGQKEIVFGLDTGKVIALELITNETILDIKLTEEAIDDLAIGNVDGDEADEIVFTSLDGIYCYDFGKEKLKWSNPMEILASEINLVIKDPKKDDQVRYEIVLLWSDRSHNYGADHHVARFSGSGDVLWSTDLSTLVSAAGPSASSLVLDLDGDGDMEVFVNDFGHSYFGYSSFGSGGTGRNLWILNATSGVLKKSMSVGQTYFTSPPMPLTVDNETCVVVCVVQKTIENAPDLLVYNGNTRKYSLVDVSIRPFIDSWEYLAFFPGPSGGTMVLGSQIWAIQAFSWDEPSVNGTHYGGSRGLDVNPIVCDIDGDGAIEILAPGNGVWIVDSESMQTKAQITPDYQWDGDPVRATNVRLTVADVDDDQRSEVIFGYYDDTGTETSYIFLLGGLDDQTDDDTPTEGRVIGWGIILFVIGANIILIALLIRDWRRKRD